VAIGAPHDDAPTLPAIEPFTVGALGPRVRLPEMALTAQAVGLIQGRPLATLERQLFDIVTRMAGGALGSGLLRMHRLDVLMGVGNALSGHDELSAEMTRGAGILRERPGAECRL